MDRRSALRLIPLAAATGMHASRGFAADTVPGILPPGAGRTTTEMPEPLTYSRRVMEMLQWVRATQSETIHEAAYVIARAVMDGRNVWSAWDLGHTNASDIFEGRNGMPELLVPGYDEDKVRDGDVVLANFPWPRGYIEDLARRDLFVVGGPCPWGGDVSGSEYMTEEVRAMKIRPYADLWIETNIDHIGAQVPIPGSAAPLGPESGPLNGTILWMMVADACRVLAREGKSVPVRGNGPILSGDDVPWVNLDAPLMDDYFDEVLRQMTLVGAEFGAIREMAGMAADTILTGKSVYYYSRYHDSLAGEATGRRGGFANAKAMSDGHLGGESGDLVIMGTYEPADERDMANLDDLKGRGLIIASIGPISRDRKVTEGRAVHKETAVHVGSMCDTSGLFAVPGFERKVCPTSGVMATTILWDMSVELVREIETRTGGDVPGIHFNGALKWGGAYNATVRAAAEKRGY
jgi:uncharacterized phosphosugar-binding protein